MPTDVSTILRSLLDKVKQRGYSENDVLRVATTQGDGLLDKFADVIADSARQPHDVFPVLVNYDLSIREAVDLGEYQGVHMDITDANFPPGRTGQAQLDLILVRFDRRMKSEDVVRQLNKDAMRPAELREFLAFGAKYPEVQRKFSIAGLGSVCRDARGYRNVPCLYTASEGRYLDLHWWDDGWYSYTRFAAVPINSHR